MIVEFYRIIKQRLQEITQLKEIDWYYEQEQQDEENTLYVDSGAYIEFEAVEWAQMGQNMQRATLAFNVHLVNENLYDNDERVLNADINHMGINALVFQKLQGFAAFLSALPEFASLVNTSQDLRVINEIVRTNTIHDHKLSNLMVTVQRFQCTVFDVSATPQYVQTTINNLNLTATINHV
jgi:predicted histidine transporter YuiF (NhaC family)